MLSRLVGAVFEMCITIAVWWGLTSRQLRFHDHEDPGLMLLLMSYPEGNALYESSASWRSNLASLALLRCDIVALSGGPPLEDVVRLVLVCAAVEGRCNRRSAVIRALTERRLPLCASPVAVRGTC